MSYSPTFKDWILRTYLEYQSNLRYRNNQTTPGIFKITSDYKLKFHDEFKTDYDNWQCGATWWEQPYHPGNFNQWYDCEQISIVPDGIQFSAIKKPKSFPDVGIIPNAIGLVRSKQSWKYGLFVFSAKLPLGYFLWPALWLSGVANWPPEIDLLESYSDDTIDYHVFKNNQSNIWVKDGNGGQERAGARTHRLPNNITNQFIEYIIWWEKDFIKLYYNGYLVRHITDPFILNGMFEAQQIIIGTGTQTGFNANNMTPMIVNKIAVYQK